MNRENIIAANPIVDFVGNRGHALVRAGENFVTRGCPATQHKRGHRPVTIYPKTQSFSCHDCKIGGTVIDWVVHEHNCSAADALRFLGGGRNGSEPIATYDYADESGELLYQVCRFKPKAFRRRQPDGNGGYIPNTKGVRRVLYRLPQMMEAETVAIAEGEKDADNLMKCGIVATCNCGGAGKWRDDFSEKFRGRNVIVFVDNDEPGKAHGDQVIESLDGIARSIKRVTLPDGFHDVSDYIASLPAKTAAQSIAKLIDSTPILKSLNSLKSYAPDRDDAVIDDFPEPLSDVAFQGLAGDIVRRILPHTEADSAALLIQIISAFGNVIGRNAFITADGSRHGMNIFSVLVGESSKSRKGTSLAHTLRVFERADEAWRQNCIANGLSSGEGLIWAVRDQITKTVPVREKGKFTGEHETVIADAGITDKRLSVVEGEFANVLKVMAREGNTLSPVIRSAWDSGNLRSMTKNSEARATGAHISIGGHITREELRRLLTETESANGFGNRFLWLAVRRSKCLPEGGNIESENLNDLVTRLHSAIEFARNTGEVTRSEDTRELWRAVYPSLSEGKPGLLGAITARAEAQVMRLSAIFALFECSTSIQPEHHRAALALWNYVERSAKWIFSTSTGDLRADRIFFALRQAGRVGMTKTEINEQVFNRNVSSGALSDALRILHQSGHVTFQKESTGGAPRERWFAAVSGNHL